MSSSRECRTSRNTWRLQSTMVRAQRDHQAHGRYPRMPGGSRRRPWWCKPLEILLPGYVDRSIDPAHQETNSESFTSAAEAPAGNVADGQLLALGGFGLCVSPRR